MFSSRMLLTAVAMSGFAWLSFIIFHQRSVKRFLKRWMIPPKGQMMMVQQLLA